jgi:fatty acid desaturase/predicted heme/steroid binding protein
MNIAWSEIARHNNAQDCWIVVDGGVYDVTGWVSQHPGGESLAILAGEDATAMFHGCHLRDIAPMLEKYRIGSVQDYAPDFATCNDEFLLTLKQRVYSFFIRTGTDYRSCAGNRKLIAWTAMLLFACWGCMYLSPPWGFPASIVMGLATCSLIGSFGHERVHGNLAASTRSHGIIPRHAYDALWGLFIPMMPERFFQYEHIKHHLHSMSPKQDYDVFALKEFVRLSPELPVRKYHAFQQFYAPFVYAIYIFLQIIGGYTTSFFQQRNLLADKGALRGVIVMSTVAILFHIVIPIYLTNVWWVLLCSLTYFCTWQAAIYLTAGVPHMTDAAAVSEKHASWSKHVCCVTKNLKCGSPLFDWLTGGLNYHLVHHLLPSIPREHLPAVSHIVEETCAEFGYPFHTYRSFRQYLLDHYQFLVDLGAVTQNQHLKSNGIANDNTNSGLEDVA